jgi:hypothetical protein
MPIRVLRRGVESPVGMGWQGFTAGHGPGRLLQGHGCGEENASAPGRATEGMAEVIKNERGQGKPCRSHILQ